MKKFTLILAIAMIALFSASAYATDFSAGGTYYAIGQTGNTVDSTTKYSYFNQRMRIAWNWTVNENVSAHLRTDFNEGTWGVDNNDSVWPRMSNAPSGASGFANNFHVDRTYIQIKNAMYSFKAGQQFTAMGKSDNFVAANLFGLQFDATFDAFSLGVVYGKNSENGSTSDESSNEDKNFYGVNGQYKAEAYGVGIAYAAVIDPEAAAPGTDVSGFALYGNAAIGSVNFWAQLDILDGDNGAEGLNFHVDGSMAVSDTVTIGGTFIFSPSRTNQITSVNGLGTAGKAFSYGGKMFEDYVWASGGGPSIYEQATNAGAIGGGIYVSMAISEAVTLYGSASAAIPEEDVTLDSSMGASAAVDWAIFPGATISAGVAVQSNSYSDNSADDTGYDGRVKCSVSF